MTSPSKRIDNSDLASSFAALFEVMVVALLGSFLVQLFFSAIHLGSHQILKNTHLLFTFMVSEASITLLLVFSFLRLRGESLRRLGWVWKKVGWEVLLGVAAVPVLFASTFAVSTFFHLVLPQFVTETNPVLELVRDPRDLALFLISSIYVGGVKEEIQRAFVLDRFERYFGAILLKSWMGLFHPAGVVTERASGRIGIIVGLILWSVFFALGHAIQGIDNAVGAGVLGMLFGLLYIWRRNLVAPMLSHALYDVVTLATLWSFFTSTA